MGRGHHQKDKLHLTTLEWQYEGGGKKDQVKSSVRRLPFNFCALSLQPFEYPVATREGQVFDLLKIVPFIKQHGCNPVTGAPLDTKSLITLNFHKDAQGKYHCPVTFKPFNEFTHLVAIATTGNVYAYDAVEQLNIKPRNWKDLLTDEPFTRADMITLQDPSDLTTRDVDSFHYLKHKLKVDEAPEANPAAAHIRLNSATSSVLDELYKTMDADKKKQQEKDAAKLKALLEQAPDEEDEYANFVPEVFSTRSTGSTAASLTSTAMTIATAQRGERVDRDTLRYAEVKTKSYVSITTNLGKLNLELHSDLVPKTVENFIRLAKKGYYNNTTFHRNIKHFMIQGGDPTATGTGGASAWGKPFADEFKPNLLHDARGIVSMANSGPGTNGSQFFITYRPCKHLDRKHTVFGKVVGGIETLAAMERIEVDKDDKPVTPITIVSVEVFVEPYRDADEKLKALFLRQQAEKLGGSVVSSSAAAASSPKAKDTPVVAASSSLSTPASGASVPAARSESKPVGSGGVGRYLAQNAAATTTGSKRPASEALEGDSKRAAVALPPAAKPRAQYGNFSNW